MHPERSSREHIFELVINEDGVGWVDSSLLDYMPVESDIRLALVDSCTEKKKEYQRDVHFKPDEEILSLRYEYLIKKSPRLWSNCRRYKLPVWR